MNLQDCITFATENPVCFMATADGNQPRVRTMMLWYADESGFYLVAPSTKALIEQLKRNPKVELCFFNNPTEVMNAKQLRVTGEVEFIDDEATKDRAYEARAFLDQIVGRSLRSITQPFRVGSGEAHFWTMNDVLREAELERVRF